MTRRMPAEPERPTRLVLLQPPADPTTRSALHADDQHEDLDDQDLYDQDLYDQVAQDAAASVIRAYSSSFGLASRLLRKPVRDHVRNVYALVRLADEIVDGPMGVRRPERAELLLDRLESETAEALTDGYSANLVVHAFASTARACGIEMDLVAPFFASMRADLSVHEHDPDSFATYVYGSAEVVGLMCLQVFVAAAPEPVRQDRDRLTTGARRLGSAFQKLNFLRDLAEDYRLRGRRYFPGLDPAELTEEEKHRLLDDIDADLAAAAEAVALLPGSSRSAVLVAHAIFTELSEQLRTAPAFVISRERIRITGPRKARVVTAALLRDRLR